MKKWLAAVLSLVIILFLGGCAGKDESPAPSETTTPMNSSFTAKGDITFGDLSATVDFSRTAPGAFTAVLTSPEALNGMTFSYEGETVQVSYKGLTLHLQEDGLAVKAMTSAIVDAINSAMGDSGMNVKVKGDTASITGENDNGAFTLSLNKKTGAFVELLIPSLDLSCKFSDFKAS